MDGISEACNARRRWLLRATALGLGALALPRGAQAKDRLLDEADKTEINVCEKCGLIAYYDAKQRKYACKIDGDQAKISTVVVAYAFKLLLQEMMSLNIAPRLRLKDAV